MNLREPLFDPETTRRYADGECLPLALALNRLFSLAPLFCERLFPPDSRFGWPGHWSFWHCAVSVGDRWILDASGLADADAVLRRLAQASPDPDLAHWRIRPVSPEAAVDHFVEDEGGRKHLSRSLLLLESGVAEAVGLIRGLPDLYADLDTVAKSGKSCRQEGR